MHFWGFFVPQSSTERAGEKGLTDSSTRISSKFYCWSLGLRSALPNSNFWLCICKNGDMTGQIYHHRESKQNWCFDCAWLRASCTNVVHDLGSAEPRSRVEPSSRWITLHQVELGPADPVQLNGHGYTVDDADWSSRAQPVGQLQWRHSHIR